MIQEIWDILNKIAIIGTLIGIPGTLYGIYTLIDKTIIVYDMYKEPNEAGGYTLHIGTYTRSDKRRGKNENNKRKYHKKGKNNDETNWI